MFCMYLQSAFVIRQKEPRACPIAQDIEIMTALTYNEFVNAWILLITTTILIKVTK
jgi:hypothetical protein